MMETTTIPGVGPLGLQPLYQSRRYTCATPSPTRGGRRLYCAGQVKMVGLEETLATPRRSDARRTRTAAARAVAASLQHAVAAEVRHRASAACSDGATCSRLACCSMGRERAALDAAASAPPSPSAAAAGCHHVPRTRAPAGAPPQLAAAAAAVAATAASEPEGARATALERRTPPEESSPAVEVMQMAMP